MNKYKIRSFTIVEVTIAMMIASLVIGVAYSIYSIVVHTYTTFNEKNKNSAELLRLDELLKIDFAKSEKILKSQNGILLRSNGMMINYEIDPEFVIRRSEIIDTFKVSAQQPNMGFESQPVTEISTEEEKNRIDDMELIFLFDKENITYHYHKQYSSVNLIQRNPDAVN